MLSDVEHTRVRCLLWKPDVGHKDDVLLADGTANVGSKVLTYAQKMELWMKQRKFCSNDFATKYINFMCFLAHLLSVSNCYQLQRTSSLIQENWHCQRCFKHSSFESQLEGVGCLHSWKSHDGKVVHRWKVLSRGGWGCFLLMETTQQLMILILFMQMDSIVPMWWASSLIIVLSSMARASFCCKLALQPMRWGWVLSASLRHHFKFGSCTFACLKLLTPRVDNCEWTWDEQVVWWGAVSFFKCWLKASISMESHTFVVHLWVVCK